MTFKTHTLEAINEANEAIIAKQDVLIAKQRELIDALESARAEEKLLHKAELASTTDLYSSALKYVAKERDTHKDKLTVAMSELEKSLTTQANLEHQVSELEDEVQHWSNLHDREHEAFVQSANDRDQAIRDKSDLRRRIDDLVGRYAQAQCFIDNICEMVACDADLSDIAEECTLWRCGDWKPEPVSTDDSDDSFFGGGEPLSVDQMLEDLSAYLPDEAEDESDAEPTIYADDPFIGPDDPVLQRRRAIMWKVMTVMHKGDEPTLSLRCGNYNDARESVNLMIERGCYEAWIEEIQV